MLKIEKKRKFLSLHKKCSLFVCKIFDYVV